VLALQRLIGNHRTTQVIARDRKRGGGNKKQATLPHQVRVGDLEPIAIRNARIRGYSVDGETERWTVVDYDEVNMEQTSIGKAR
jgi:hypothetical protein